jgi:hypothetical protein
MRKKQNQVSSIKRRRAKKYRSKVFFGSICFMLFTLLFGCNEYLFKDNAFLWGMNFSNENRIDDKNLFTMVEIKADTSPTMKVAVQACAGLYNRQRGGSVYTHMSNKDLQWLEELNIKPEETMDASSFLETCLEDFPKTVRYSYDNQQKLLPNILTVGAVLEAVPLDDDMLSAFDTVVFDATVEFKELNTPYLATKYVYDHYVNKTTGLAMLNPGYCKVGCDVSNPELTGDMESSLVDFVYSQKLFVTFLVNGCNILDKEYALMNTIASVNPWPKPIGVYGYNNSWMVFGGYLNEAQTKCVAARNMGAIPTEVSNLSFFSTRRESITSAKELYQNEPEDIDYDPNKTFVAFVLGDGDNIAFMMDARRNWFSERLNDCSKSDNSCAPLTWTISPHLTYIAPDVLEWYYEMGHKTGKDYFMLPPSGYLYAYPSSLAGDMQDKFVSYTEEAAYILGTSSTVNWEWFDSWAKSEKEFLPKYAKKGGEIKGIFPVNVPFLFPTLTWKPNQFYKVLAGKDGGDAVLFVPRSWRGIDNSGNFITNKFYLSPDKMADELNGYPKGTVAYVYMTSDGGLNLSNSFIKMVKLLSDHVCLISADTAARLALQSYNNSWGNPVSFKTAHGKYLVAENNGGKTVNANRTTIGPWERFHLISKGRIKDGAQISIQTGGGYYFSAQPKGALDANRTAIGPWEEFILINHSSPGGYLKNGHVVSLKSAAFNKYVVAEDDGSCNVNRVAIGPWEKFTVYFHKN